jgi:RimJ/RimL family protein N-acetyltransferase
METNFPSEGWPTPALSSFTGQFIDLEPLDLERHGTDLFAGTHPPLSDGQLWNYLPAGPFQDAAAFVQWLEQRRSEMLIYTMVHRVTRRAIGSISLMRITPAHGVAELGFIWVEPAFQGTVANREANLLLLEYCFQALRYRRMEWKCNAENERSRRAALRIGYTFEGIFRQHMVVKGQNRDTAWFSILDHEWPEVRERLRRELNIG